MIPKKKKKKEKPLRRCCMQFHRLKQFTLGDYLAQATTLLDMALFFQSKTWEWWWLAERLYQSALLAAKLIDDDDAETITFIRYLYGRFLFYQR